MSVTLLTESEKQVSAKLDKICDEIEIECRGLRDPGFACTLRHNIDSLADFCQGIASRLESLSREMDEVAKSEESSAGLPIGEADWMNYRRASFYEISAGTICAECLRCKWDLEYMGGPGKRFCLLRGEYTKGRRTCDAFEVCPCNRGLKPTLRKDRKAAVA
jgi:hypothetical protein